MSYECLMILKSLMTINPGDRAMLKNVMKDRWLNLGQEEELRPYTESPCDNMDPWVNKGMLTMWFEWDHIQDSMTRRGYDRLMATFLILSTKNSR